MSDVSENISYVEVIGEASYDEPIERFQATVSLEVRAVKEETALAQLNQLVERCIARLLASGLARDEIENAGANLDRPWWWRKKERQVGKVGHHRLLLKCDNLGRLTAALASIENVPADTREAIEVSMDRPSFRNDETVRLDAMNRAVKAARQAASTIAAAEQARIGRMLRAEEGSSVARHSGFSGDYDWAGDYNRFSMGGAAGAVAASAGEASSLATPVRTIWVRCRVRFELLQKP